MTPADVSETRCADLALEDQDVLRPLIASFNRETASPQFARSAAQAARLIDAVCASPDPVYGCLARRGAQPVGFAIWHFAFQPLTGERGAYICQIYVAPTLRREGIARRLLAFAARRTAEQGGGFLTWNTDPGDPVATPFSMKMAVLERPYETFVVEGDAFQTLRAAAVT